MEELIYSVSDYEMTKTLKISFLYFIRNVVELYVLPKIKPNFFNGNLPFNFVFPHLVAVYFPQKNLENSGIVSICDFLTFLFIHINLSLQINAQTINLHSCEFHEESYVPLYCELQRLFRILSADGVADVVGTVLSTADTVAVIASTAARTLHSFTDTQRSASTKVNASKEIDMIIVFCFLFLNDENVDVKI